MAYIIKKAQPYQVKAIIFDTTSTCGKNPPFPVQDFKNLAQHSIGIHHIGYENTLQSLIKRLFFLEKEISELESALEEEINKTLSPKKKDLLIDIKGLSQKMVNRFLAEIEDMKKFSSAEKLIKSAGLDPMVKQSGRMIAGVNKIVKVLYAVLNKGEEFREELSASSTVKSFSLKGNHP